MDFGAEAKFFENEQGEAVTVNNDRYRGMLNGKWACDRLTEDADFGKKKKIIFSDEADFDLGGYVNKQNYRIWGTENLNAYIEKPTHPKRVTVWCEFWSRGIIGQIFFENEQREAVAVNGDRYRAMLNEFLFTKIEEETYCDRSTYRCCRFS